MRPGARPGARFDARGGMRLRPTYEGARRHVWPAMRLSSALLAALLALAAPAAAQIEAPRTPAASILVHDGPCAAYLDAFDTGLVAYRAGALDLARRAWTEAAATTECGPDAAYNLAIVAAETGDLRAAADRFAETLARLRGWDVPEAARDGVRTMRQLALAGLFNVAVGQLDAADTAPDSLRAAEATLTRLLAADPLYRDALYNRAVAHRRLNDWADVRDDAERLLAFDPLSRTAHTLRFEALRALGDPRRAGRALTALRSLPVDVERIDIRMRGAEATVSGTVEAGAARAGTPIRIDLTLLSPDGPLATQTLTFAAPAAGDTTAFTATFPAATGATAYRYRVR